MPGACYNAAVESQVSNEAGTPAARQLTVVLLAVLLVLLFFWRLGALPLLEPDEGRYTEIPREMLANHDFVTPRLDGVLYFEKPPLVYWANAAAIAAFGLNEFASRLASAALGLAGLALAYALGRVMGSRRAGLIAAAALGTMPLHVALGRLATIDMVLSFCLTATLACFWLAHREEDPRRARWLWLGMFAAAALALLAKGLIGVVIPGAIVFLYLLATRGWSVLRRVRWVGGITLFLAIGAPWHVLAALRNPDFLWFYFVHEHLLRYLTPIAERHEPIWYFVAVLALGCAPWSGLAVASLRSLRGSRWRERFAGGEAPLFLLLWAGFALVFFSISQSKLIPYVLPAVPPLAVLAALHLDRLLDGGAERSWLDTGAIAFAVLAMAAYGALFLVAGFGRVHRPGLVGVVSPALIVPGAIVAGLAIAVLVASFAGSWGPRMLLLFAGGCALVVATFAAGPVVARERSSRDIATALRDDLQPNDLVYCYRDFPESLPVYLQREVGVVGYLGELTFGASHLDAAARTERFPNVAEFVRIWSACPRVWLVVPRGRLGDLDRDGIPGGRLVAATQTSVLLVNR